MAQQPDQTVGEAIAYMLSGESALWQESARRIIEFFERVEGVGLSEGSRHITEGPAGMKDHMYEIINLNGLTCLQLVPVDTSTDRVVLRLYYDPDTLEVHMVVRGRVARGSEDITDRTILHSTYPELRPGDPAPF